MLCLAPTLAWNLFCWNILLLTILFFCIMEIAMSFHDLANTHPLYWPMRSQLYLVWSLIWKSAILFSVNQFLGYMGNVWEIGFHILTQSVRNQSPSGSRLSGTLIFRIQSWLWDGSNMDWDMDGGMQLPDSNQTFQQLSVPFTIYLVDSASRARICTVLQYLLSYQSGFNW